MKHAEVDLNRELRIELLRLLITARQVDQVIGKADSHWHASYGEEAVPVGCFSALLPTDISIPHYRSAVIASLVRGADLRRLIAGVLGKVTGPGRGRPRAEIMGDVGSNHFAMFSGTLGPTLGYATGAGLASKLQKSGRVALVTFGDGTVNSGLFHESLNMASMFKLPTIFVCQDNQYAITTRADVAIPGSITARGSGYGMPAIEVDGNDVLAVYAQVRQAADRARAGEGPTFIHAVTYRLGGHWSSDPTPYRSKEEVAHWAARDPIPRLSAQLLAEGAVTQARIDAFAADATAQATAALEAAQADPWPAQADLQGEAYA